MYDRLVSIFFCTLIFSGCSPKEKAVEILLTNPEPPISTMDGISVSTLKVQPTVENITEIMNQYGEPIVPVELYAKLSNEGMLVRKISAMDIPDIVRSIGNVIDDQFAWHGQILQWRDLHQSEIDPRGMRISEQGVQYFIQSGYLSLLSRSWTIEREDGVHVYLQFLPTWHVPKNRSSITGKSSGSVQNKVFYELGFEALLDNDEAIMLLVKVVTPSIATGPFDEGPPSLRLGEALLGGSQTKDYVHILIIEASLIPRG
jgi:hypothetical protein